MADHLASTTADIVRRVGPAVPVQAHLTRLEHEGALSRSPTRKTWAAYERATPASPNPQRADAPALAPTAAAVARALRERAAPVEEADGTGPGQGDSLTGLRSALLHDLAAALEAAPSTLKDLDRVIARNIPDVSTAPEGSSTLKDVIAAVDRDVARVPTAPRRPSTLKDLDRLRAVRQDVVCPWLRGGRPR